MCSVMQYSRTVPILAVQLYFIPYRTVKGANEIVSRIAYSVQIRPLRELWELWDLHQSIPRVEIGFISKVIYIMCPPYITPYIHIYGMLCIIYNMTIYII